MDRGGDSGAHGDDTHHDDAPDSRDLSGSPGSAAPRQWTHPSELGLQARVRVDRRRSRALVIGLVAIGAGVLLGTAAMATVFSQSTRGVTTESANVPLADCLALVDVMGTDGSTHVTGLLVDDGRHVLVVGEDLEAADRLAVRIGGSRTTATVVAQDPYADLVLLQLETSSGSPPEMSSNPVVGDSLRIVHFDSAGNRRSSQVRVDDVALTWSRPDHTVADGVMALSGDTADSGVLADPNGAVAGLVIGTVGRRSVAYGSDMLASQLDRLQTGGTIERPWIGVRAGDISSSEEGVTTPVGGPNASRPAVGALVVDVVPGSPADRSGLIAGDLVTSVAGRPVHNMEDLLAAVAPLSPGDLATVEISRAGAPVSLTVEVAAFPG
jgi:hypothetical protein